MRNPILILLVIGVSYSGVRFLSGPGELAGRISIATLFCFTALGHFAKSSMPRRFEDKFRGIKTRRSHDFLRSSRWNILAMASKTL
jgi:hypothetical protein